MEEALSVFKFCSIEHKVMETVLTRMRTRLSPEKVFQPVILGFDVNEVVVTSRVLGIMRKGSSFVVHCWEELLARYPNDTLMMHYHDWEYGPKRHEVKIEDTDGITIHAGEEAKSLDMEAVNARLSKLESSLQQLVKADIKRMKVDIAELKRKRGGSRADADAAPRGGGGVDGANPVWSRNSVAPSRGPMSSPWRPSLGHICLKLSGPIDKRDVVDIVNWREDLLAIHCRRDHFILVVKAGRHRQYASLLNGMSIRRQRVSCEVCFNHNYDTEFLIRRYGLSPGKKY